MSIQSNLYIPTTEPGKSLLRCIWSLQDDSTDRRKEVILPKGTVELIFNFSDKISFVKHADRICVSLPELFINGINFHPFELVKEGKQSFLGIQLYSSSLMELFQISAEELNNNVFQANLICPELKALFHKLSEQNTFSDQVYTILDWIRIKLNGHRKLHHIHRLELLKKLCARTERNVSNLSEEMALSDRQLRRFCKAWLAMNTEEYIQYQRYLASLHSLHNKTISLTEIGFESGYYDQAHFIRAFKSFTQLTPGQYRKFQSNLPGHIYG